MKRGLRIVVWLVVVLLLAATAGVLALLFSGGSVIKTAVNKAGPSVMGVPVTLQDAEFKPLRGLARLHGLHVGNPKGFQTDGLFDVADVTLELDTLSLFTGTLHIQRIFIDTPRFTYERGEEGSNLDRVLDQLGAGKKSKGPNGGEATTNEPAAHEPAATSKPAKGPEKKVIIDELVISNAAVRAHLPVIGEVPTIAMGSIVVRDVGKAEGGVPFKEATKTITKQIAAHIDQNVQAVAGSLKTGLKQIEQQAKPLIDSIKGLFQKDKKKKDAK